MAPKENVVPTIEVEDSVPEESVAPETKGLLPEESVAPEETPAPTVVVVEPSPTSDLFMEHTQPSLLLASPQCSHQPYQVLSLFHIQLSNLIMSQNSFVALYRPCVYSW